jgi:pyruvate, water dikinase
MDNSFISWLSDLSITDANQVGEKAAYLAELYNKKISVPNAFVISSEFYDKVIQNFKIELEDALNPVSDIQSAYNAAAKIRGIFAKFSLSPEARDTLLTNYKKITAYVEHERMSDLTKQLVTSGRDLPFVAIRASPTKNFPFQLKPVLNAYGSEQISEAIKKVLMSAFSPQAIYYRYINGIGHFDFSVAIIVQKMAHAVKSGDMFTINPIKNSKSEIYAQAVWGINNGLMDNPSSYVFDKQSKKIVDKKDVNQKTYYTKNAQFGELLLEPLPDNMQKMPVLTERELSILADLGAKVEHIMNFPQHIEWAVERNSIHVVQTRPITRIFEKPLISSDAGTLLNSASGSGKATHVSSKEDFQRINSESVIISNTLKGIFPYLVQSAGIVSGLNGITSPMSQICRTFSIPAVFQAKEHFNRASEGQEIQFNGQECTIIQPVISSPPQPPYPQQQSQQPQMQEYMPQNPTTEEPPTQSYTESEFDELLAIKEQFEQLEKKLTEEVSRQAQKRATGEQSSEEDFRKSQLISELEWQVRNLRKKLLDFSPQ